MSLGQCISAIDAWNRVHGGPEKPQAPDADWYDKMKELHPE